MKKRALFLSIILAFILSIVPVPTQWNFSQHVSAASESPYLYSKGEDNVSEATAAPTEEPEKTKSMADIATNLFETLLTNNKVNICVLLILCASLAVVLIKNNKLKK